MAVQEASSVVPVAVVTDSSPRTMTTSYALDTAPPPGRSPTATSGEQQHQQSKQKMEEDLTLFWPLYVAAQVIGVTAVILVTVWTTVMGGGFAWRSNPSLEFNWHPLLMVVGFVFLFGNTIMIYRGVRVVKKKKVKLVHAGLSAVALLCVVVAQIAVFDSHNLASPPIPNLYSLHSWIGLTTIIMFFSQWVFGLCAYLWPGASMSIRVMLMPYHVFLGVTIFGLAVISCVTGLLEKAIFKLGSNYSSLPGEALLINLIGFVILLYAMLVGFIVTNPKFKRYANAEDAALLTKNNVND